MWATIISVAITEKTVIKGNRRVSVVDLVVEGKMKQTIDGDFVLVSLQGGGEGPQH